MTKETEQTVIKCIAHILNIDIDIDIDRIQRGHRFAHELDADSLDLLELIMHVEITLEIELEDALLEDVDTVQDLIDLVQKELDNKPTAPSSSG